MTNLFNLDSKASTTLFGTGAVAQLTITDGVVDYRTTGALGGNTVISGAGTLTFDGDSSPKTVTNPLKVYSSSVTVDDTFGVTGSLVANCYYCAPGNFNFGQNVAITRAIL